MLLCSKEGCDNMTCNSCPQEPWQKCDSIRSSLGSLVLSPKLGFEIVGSWKIRRGFPCWLTQATCLANSHDWAYGPDVRQTYTGTEACPGIPTFVKASCGSTGICAPGREVKDSQTKFEFFVPRLVRLANSHFLRLFIMRIPDDFCSLVLTWQDAHWCMAWDQYCGLHWPGRQDQSLHVCLSASVKSLFDEGLITFQSASLAKHVMHNFVRCSAQAPWCSC